ncbi:uncharacterized protein DUF1573 [Sphingobacterium allocomposti]|uniref:Uncharacterized protein DUF1573 n=1 Tax=Sphingobacterium allocomposti TaxID=415956 RepID=A0A5S5CXT0_9SPHI|nr:DUF1573 domain-containing protein [Sphingobacterium composti Yoo et al. 2007 non Ten et al. 2007]TYP87828.1 uncharacterized protein DUF1573 [Sphingobacterium composti Yoo et al. 2007 non Ten et al. 2007]
MKYVYINCFFMVVLLLMFCSCIDVANKKTTLAIEDNGRHYYPLLAGQQKDLSFNLKNTGKNPLLITDIITSCGCLKADGDGVRFSIPPGKERMLTLSYNSAKNVGYVKHYVMLYGNFEGKAYEEITFDINVVPNAMYTKDYEELYAEEVDSRAGVEQLVEGEENNKGYYMDEDFKKSIHDNK